MTTPSATVLVVEDDPKIRAQLVYQLRDAGHLPRAVGSAEDALRHLETERPQLLVLDVRLPELSGVELVRRLAEEDRLPPAVMVSGEASITEVVEALRLGVHDFVEKPFRRERLLRSVENALSHAALTREVEDLRSELDGETQMLATSPPMLELEERLAKAAATDARILIRGESGTGKELVAEEVHRRSARADKPFVRVNCAAIPAHLVESELFGHVKGAFTDARQDRAGLFEAADGGTLFLDEIGDMGYELQSRLLRVLEDGRVRRLGDTRDRLVDVRVLVATHRDLETAVAEGTMREDLFYRLAHLVLEVPPLRDREGDVEILFAHFLDRFARRHRVSPRTVSDELRPLLRAYHWPGNVRELRNLAERLVVFGSETLRPDDLPSSFFADARGPETGLVRLGDGVDLDLREFRAQCEREYVEHILRRTGWNVAEAARRLGLRRTYLHEKITALGLRRPD